MRDPSPTVAVDGWRVVADLREDDPRRLRGAGVRARALPAVQRDGGHVRGRADGPARHGGPGGGVQVLQLACPLDVPPERVESFYAAYRRLGAMIDSPRYRVVFKASDGDLLTLHGHRVLHGRLPFDPTSGARHLQDVYMEWDDLMARRRVLRGEHVPLPATPADAS